jgi:hypothetical protein
VSENKDCPGKTGTSGIGSSIGCYASLKLEFKTNL